MQIKTVLFLLTIAWFVIPGATGPWLKTAIRDMTLAVQFDKTARSITHEMLQLHTLTSEYLLHPQTSSRAEWQSSFDELGRLLRQGRTGSGEESREIASLQRGHQDLGTGFERLVQLVADSQNAVGGGLPDEPAEAVQTVISSLLDTSRSMSAATYRLGDSSAATLTYSSREVGRNFAYFVVSIAFAIAGTSIVLVHRVAQPVRKLQEGLQILGSGNLDHKINVRGRNEIAEIGNSIDEMVDRLKEVTVSRDEMARERDQSEKRLQQSTTQVQAVLRNLFDGVISTDNAGRIISFNAAAERAFGYAAGEVVGRDIAMLFPGPDDHRDDGDHPVKVAIRDGRVLGMGAHEIGGRRKDGSTFPLEIAASEIGLGNKRGFIFALHDITERKRAESAEDQLRQAQKMEAVGRLTGGIAHDFNNLLTIIVGNLQLLERSSIEDERHRRWITKAANAALRGASLNKGLLAFARRQVLEPKALDMNELISGLRDLIRRPLPENIEIDFELADDLWPVYIDRNQLESALLNLVINARDAMPEGGTLTIRTANARSEGAIGVKKHDLAPGDYATFEVTDTGIGMPSEVLEHVFEPFFTTKESGKGTGLGLSMVYGFIKQSGGHITVSSDPGKGARVKAYLPRSEALTPATTATPQVPEADRAVGETVLVVEDEADLRDTAVEVLRGLNYRVLDAENGPAALALVDGNQSIDLLFTDVVMPGGMNGPTLAKMLRKRIPGIRVLYTSGYAKDAISAGGVLDEGTEFISKPWVSDDLARKIRHVLEAPRQSLVA